MSIVQKTEFVEKIFAFTGVISAKTIGDADVTASTSMASTSVAIFSYPIGKASFHYFNALQEYLMTTCTIKKILIIFSELS